MNRDRASQPKIFLVKMAFMKLKSGLISLRAFLLREKCMPAKQTRRQGTDFLDDIESYGANEKCRSHNEIVWSFLLVLFTMRI